MLAYNTELLTTKHEVVQQSSQPASV
jgi:hypothetical protein